MMNNDSAVQTTRVQTDYPYQVDREVRDVIVTDGTRLSIKTWIPHGITTGVVLEAIPYRKDDVSLVDDEARFAYLAGHGIACARLDLRGSGSSSGVLMDEYTRVEQGDIEQVIGWLAAQEWCNGSVGMVGISWSGFNALQLATRRPEALKAIITTCSSDDRYDNDVHYLGGVPLAFYMNLWGSALRIMNMRPPKPEPTGADWLSEWTTRLHSNPDVTSLWLAHPYRDSYWQQGSVCEDYAAIRCGVLLVGGWADNYTDTVFRVLERVPGAQGLVGPWGHTWPERPWPGGGVDFLKMSLRWWQHWLLGRDNGVRDDPTLRFFIQDAAPPDAPAGSRPGRWMATRDPWHVVDDQRLCLGLDGELGVAAPAGSEVTHRSDLTVGTRAGHPLPMGLPTDLPGPQESDDERSLVFQTEPLADPLTMLGSATVHLRVSSTAPTGLLFARITDVDPCGRSHLVSRGAINLAHRRGHAPDQAAPMVPGEPVTVDIPLKAASYRFPPGHRLRLAISTNYWPWLWPAPDQGAVTLGLADSALSLPTLREGDALLEPVELGEPVIGPTPELEVVSAGTPSWLVESDEEGWTYVRRSAGGATTVTLGDGWTIRYLIDDSEYAIRADHPLSARMSRVMEQSYSWSEHEVQLSLTTTMTGDADTFAIDYTLRALLDGALQYQSTSTTTVPRGL